MNELYKEAKMIVDEVQKAVVGKADEIERIMMTIIAGRHGMWKVIASSPRNSKHKRMALTKQLLRIIWDMHGVKRMKAAAAGE